MTHLPAQWTARDVAAECLAVILRAATFTVWGSDERTFQLQRVLTGWPHVSEPKFRTPSASIGDVGDEAFDDNGAIESADDEDDANDLVTYRAEASGSFSVNIWATDQPELDALRAGIPALFRGGSGNHSLMCEVGDTILPTTFKNRSITGKVRLSLSTLPRDTTDAMSVRGERHARFAVDWDAEVVTSTEAQFVDGFANRGGVTTEEI